MATNARPPVDIAADNWAQRIDSMVGAGFKKKTIKQKIVPIMEEDLRMVQHGGQAMANDAAILGAQAAIAGRPVLQKEEDHDWDPTEFFGDVTRDISDLTWKTIPALARFTVNLPTHARLTAEAFSKQSGNKADQKWMREHGYERLDPLSLDPSSWARQLRNVSRTPLFGVIPGLHTAAGLTTPKGRMDLAHHPVMTALDVLPYAQAASRGAGIAAKAGATEGSVAEAALQAKPLKAAYRMLPEELRANVGKKTLAGLRKVGLDPESFGMARGLDIEHRKAQAAFNAELKNSSVIDDIAKLPDEERTLLTEEAAYPDRYPDMSLEHREILSRVEQFNEQLAAKNPQLKTISREAAVPEPGFATQTPEGAPLTDATGIPNEQLGWVGGKPRSASELLPEDRAAEAAILQQHALTKEPDFVRADEGGQGVTGDRRSPEGRRLAEERRQGEVEGYAEEKRATDRRQTPEQREAVRRQKRAQRESIANQWDEKARVAEEAGNTELAAAFKDNADTARQGFVNEEALADEALGTPLDPEMTPEAWAKWDAEMEQLAVASGRVKRAPETVKRDYVYPADSPVAMAHESMLKAEERLSKVLQDSGQKTRGFQAEETFRRMKEVDRRAKSVDLAQKRVEAAQRSVARAQKSSEGRGKVATLEKAMDRMDKALKNLENRRAQAEDAGSRLTNLSNKRIEAQGRRVAKARAMHEQRAAEFEKTFQKNPPANMIPMMERIAKDRMIGRVEMQPWAIDEQGRPIAGGPGETTASYVDDAINQIERADTYQVMAPEEWQALRREVMDTWQDMADQGYHPVWSHNVDVTQAGRAPTVKPLSLRNVKETQVRERVGDLTPKIDDLAVSMSHAAAEYIRVQATKAYMDMFLVPRTAKWGEIRDFLHKEVDLMKAKGEIPRGVGEDGALQIALNKHYVEWNPDAWFETQRPKLTGTATAGETKTYLPRHLEKIARDLIQPRSPNAFVRAAASTSKLYKTSIMAFSMKHMAHISLGGTVMLGLRGGLDELMNIGKAWRMVKDGELPVGLSKHLDIDTPDQLFQYAAGNKLGKLYGQSLGRVAKAKMKFDEFFVNFQRADSFLAEQSRALRGGATKAEAVEAGLNHTYKTLVDIDGMNSLERNVLRQVMPFYAFMRHTLKYILTYPIDHPMRAAILSRMAAIEQKDWETGLPDQLQTLFFLGTPNAHGDITGVEMRQFNPFRDTGSYFTWAGFFKAIHPAASLPFTLAGGDKFTGTAELYPELEVDERTGNLVAKRPPNAPWTIATTIVPELGLLDHFGGITAEMRELKAKNPEAYKARMWQMLFVPFEPKTVNKPLEAAELQQNILKIAQQDVSKSLSSGNTGGLGEYPVVPYQGELVQPEALTNLVNYIKRIRPDVSPRSALPAVKLSKL